MRHAIAAAAALALLSAPALAGDYHSGAALNCQDCHTMHYSQQHGFNGQPWAPPLAGGPYHYLLKGEINDLCLSCHDGQTFAPDVLEIETGGATGVPRNAGALNRDGTAPYEVNNGHTLDSTDDAPGSNPTWNNPDGLNCVDCHNQHGRGGASGASLYKNLNSDVGNYAAWGDAPVTYYVGLSAPPAGYTQDVWQAATGVYHEATTEWLEPDNTTSAIGNWCAGCHTEFHGDPGGTNIGGVGGTGAWVEFVRHPDGGVNIGDIGGGHSNLNMYKTGERTGTGTSKTNYVKVMSESAQYGTNNPGDATPTCISCHKAHGNQNSFGLIWRQGQGTLTEEGDTGGPSTLKNTYANLCGQCHVQAAAFAVP